MSAVFSPCGRYRYRLDRDLQSLFGGFALGFCLHNPSTADALLDDPTLRRCIAFASAAGAGRLVVNAWAGRATDPADLWRLDDPVGPENDAYIADAADEVAASGGFMVVGWGVPKPPDAHRAAAAARLADVAALIAEQTCETRALARNADGSPKHPLYVAGHVRPAPWSPPGAGIVSDRGGRSALAPSLDRSAAA